MVSFKIATRFLGSSKGQTVLIVIGIAIAISVQVFVGLLLSNLQASLLESTVGNSPHVTIESSLENVTIDDWDQTIQEAEDVSGIKAITASASSNAFIKKGEKVEPALLRGFDFDEADKIYHMLDALYEGKRPQTNTQCILGKELGEELGVGVGANVSIITSFGTSHDLIISGLYDLGIESLNKAWVMTTVGAAQGIFQFGD